MTIDQRERTNGDQTGLPNMLLRSWAGHQSLPALDIHVWDDEHSSAAVITMLNMWTLNWLLYFT